MTSDRVVPSTTEHPDCGCSLVQMDCCDPLRWECETLVALDSDGTPDVRVCKRGFGCDTEDAMWERFREEQQATLDLAERITRYEGGEEDA